ncbi:tyrosine-protein phosphatase non-receptor type 18 isoform X4 [Sciurus carolinensis]|uniref:tyrosine-protein phosphatase non-receptor type 18 isoform X4 n=1 Tax=Sciurus carolinensis TaxID=30640 RepID=UPI001FB421A5|nr:tyrosine-protein phosphatase non-receptor type 18 isoform X4 [Sciurus carolinensis]
MSCSLAAARSFLEHLEQQGGRKGTVLAAEFSDIRARSAAWKADGVRSTDVGSRPENMQKNRYKDVVPYDQTRVILSLLQEEGHGDYINGNFIQGTDGNQSYIATQGPLPHTLLDFWRLVWEFEVKVILMACQETENGRKKCERYWAQEHKPLKIGFFYITLMIPPNFSLFDLVLEMRKQRPAVVQTEEQYRFLYHTVAQMFYSAVQTTSPRYQNLKEFQTPSPHYQNLKEVQTTSPHYQNLKEVQITSPDYQNLKEVQTTSPDYQNLKENCAPLYDDALSHRTSPALLAVPRPPGGVLRSISVPGAPTLPMADTYAVVQKRQAPAGAGPVVREHSTEEKPLYSQVKSHAQRPGAQAEDVRGSLPGRVPANQSPAGPDAYEDVAEGAQTGGLGFNLRIGRPKGPRDPPAEWTRVFPLLVPSLMMCRLTLDPEQWSLPSMN